MVTDSGAILAQGDFKVTELSCTDDRQHTVNVRHRYFDFDQVGMFRVIGAGVMDGSAEWFGADWPRDTRLADGGLSTHCNNKSFQGQLKYKWLLSGWYNKVKLLKETSKG